MFVRNPCLGLRLWTVDQNFFTFAAAQNLRVADGQLKISSSFILKKSLERVRKQKSNSLSAWKWGGRVEERKLLSLKMRSHSKKKKKKRRDFHPMPLNDSSPWKSGGRDLAFHYCLLTSLPHRTSRWTNIWTSVLFHLWVSAVVFEWILLTFFFLHIH